MKRALKRAAFGVFCAAMLVVAAALCMLAWPGILINARTLGIGARLAARAGYEIRWSDARVAVDSIRLLDKRLRLELDDLCVTTPRERGRASVEGCFDHAAISLEAGFAKLKPRLREIGPIDLRGGEIVLRLAAEPSEKRVSVKKASGSSRIDVPEWLAGAVIRPIRVDVGVWSVEQPGALLYRGSLRVTSATRPGGAAEVALHAEARGRRAGERRSDRGSADIELGSPPGFWRLAGWRARARASVRLGDGTAARVDASLSARGEQAVEYRVSGSYLERRTRVVASLRGAYAPDRLSATIDGSARGLVPELRVVRVRGCSIELRRRGAESAGGAAAIRCPIGVAVPPPPSGFPGARLPSEAGATLTADLATSSYPPSASSGLSGHARVDLEPILTPLLRGEGSVESSFGGIPADFPAKWKMDTRLALKAAIPRFERLVAELSGTPWDVPAPLRVLRGSIELGVDGRLDAVHGKFPIRFASRLASPGEQGGQKLDLDAAGDLTWHGAQAKPEATLTLDVALKEVRLQLPRLERKPPPRFYPDSRIHGEEARPNPGGGSGTFAYSVRVRTPAGSPARIVSNLAEAPVPIALDVTLASAGGLGGEVKVMDFPFEVFRRRASLDHFDIALAAQTQDSAVDGEIHVPYTDYTVSVLLLGTIGKPRMVLQSDPPLPESQLWAVLLFGQPIEDLDPVQSETVGQTRSAVADGVLSLPSMFLLASTPVQSLAYDPRTGQVSMKVRLGEGTSLNLQEGASQLQSVGIRKRLGPHWSITTDVDRPPDSTGSEVTAFLEWSHRY